MYSAKDKKVAEKLLGKLYADAVAKTKPRQIREVIPVDKWLENKYFVGNAGLSLYPFWKEQMIDIFSGENKYNEIILEAALGVGKTTVGNFMMIRKLYELSCYENIQARYGLMSTSRIYLMYFTLTLSSAKKTGFVQLKDTLDSIPYFQNDFVRNVRNDSELIYPNGITISYGSNINHQIGTNLIFGMLDEANFHEGAESAAEKAMANQSLVGVMNLYNSIINRGSSRFIHDGKNESLAVLISSPKASSSVTQARIDASANSDTTKVIHCRKWEVKPKDYTKERFWVFLGNNRLDPFIVETVEDLDRIINSEGLPLRTSNDIDETIKHFDPGLKACFDHIPVNVKNYYETNIISAIQDISGRTTAPTGRLFTSKKLFTECIDENLPDVFWRNEFTISTGDESDTNSINHYFKGPFLAPSVSRYIHIDQSLATDCTGMACTYRGKPILLDGEEVPTFIVEYALRITPPKRPFKISISKVRAFIYYMTRIAGLKIGKVTYDTFQSAEALEDLQRNGIANAHLSMDRTDQQYLTFVDLIQQGRIKFSKQVAALISTELFDLNHYRDKGKVDHMPNKCLVGDTLIRLADKSVCKIQDLVGKKRVMLCGCTPDHKIVPVLARKIWETMKTKELVEVKLSNNTSFKCTPTHRVLMYKGIYRTAKSLKKGDELASSFFGKIRKFEAIDTGMLPLFVEEVVPITLEEEVPVYDIEVPGFHNFVLGNGAVVHNSKDVMDAVVGSVWNALKSENSDIISGIDMYNTLNVLKDSEESTFSELIDKYLI